MDVVQLKEKLYNNAEDIQTLLEKAGFENIYPLSGKSFRFGFDDGSNNTTVNIETLKSTSFSRNINGDIFTLLGMKLGKDFFGTFKWCCQQLGYSSSYNKREINLPFSGVWRKFSKAET